MPTLLTANRSSTSKPPFRADVDDLSSEANKLDHFRRSSSGLRRYFEYLYHIKQTYGSVLAFVQQERLRWPDLTPSGATPFTNTDDYRVLFNDWPYHLELGVEHLVIWVKFPIPETPDGNKVAEEAKQQIEDWVRKTFCGSEEKRRMKRNDIIWFKNWKRIKSVHAIGEWPSLS
jgi:hypothetical protein